MKPRNHGRAAGQTHITVSLPADLANYITRAAKAENRSRSNWIVTRIQEMLSQKQKVELGLGMTIEELALMEYQKATKANETDVVVGKYQIEPQSESMAAEVPNEPGKIIDPAAVGGAKTAPGMKYPKAKAQKSSRSAA